MCGIAGIWSEQQPPRQDEIDTIVDLLVHRGPDDRGTFLNGPLGFGMRRLSIIDLSSGKQPISNEDNTKHIVFNGEIYNYQTLRTELAQAGHTFRSKSDTETILHCYEEYGAECVHKLQGMFAFAIWDQQAQRLFIARDRWGIKPLFYSWDGKRCIFSSELKSLAAISDCTLSLESLNHFFSFLYYPDSCSPYNEVEKLLPGHHLTIERGNITVQQYYHLPNAATQSQARYSAALEEDYVEQFFELATEVLQVHLLSEVPLGAFLSGGVDSSLIVAMMSQLIDTPVNTFSIGYEHGGEHFDERSYARLVAQRFSTNHRELLVSPHEIQQRLPEILQRLDEPFGDASVLPNYLLSEFTRQHVTVALSGLGGDEVCGGYERYLGALLAERYPRMVRTLNSPLAQSMINALPDSKRGAQFPERLKRFAQHAALPLAERYFSFISKFSEAQKESLFTQEARKELHTQASWKLFEAIWSQADGRSPLSQILHTDMKTYLVDDLLTLSDRTSMAHSIEMRVPFVDHLLVEFFARVPDSLKIKGFEKKYLLKKAAERLLPKEIIYRKKAGFSVPLAVWFRTELRDYLQDTLSSHSFTSLGIFESKYIQSLLREHETQTRNHDERLFALLSFAVWKDSLEQKHATRK